MNRNISLKKIAQIREKKWLIEHGAHKYNECNLINEAIEELADAYNYLNAYCLINNQKSSIFLNLQILYEIIIALENEIVDKNNIMDVD